MRDCSVVTATYEMGEGMKGTVGIIGPKRMDYDKVVGILKNLMNQLETLSKKTENGVWPGRPDARNGVRLNDGK